MEEQSGSIPFHIDLPIEPQEIESAPVPSLTSFKSFKQIDLGQLVAAQNRFVSFAQSLGVLKYTPVSEEIYMYSAGQFKKKSHCKQVLGYNYVLSKLSVRIEKMRKTKKLKKNWGEQDLIILIWVISKHCEFHHIEDHQQLTPQDWKTIASLIPMVTPQSCMFKWLSLKKVTFLQNSWSYQQSQHLDQLVRLRNNNPIHCSQIKDWKAISQELYNTNPNQEKCFRNAKQCRQHWNCYLSPKLKKGPWKLTQDIKLLTSIKNNHGNKKWSQIARDFVGRTQNALKNRYMLLLDKQKRGRNRGRSQIQLINQFLQSSYMDQLTGKIKGDQEFPQLQPLRLSKHHNYSKSEESSQKSSRYKTNKKSSRKQSSSMQDQSPGQSIQSLKDEFKQKLMISQSEQIAVKETQQTVIPKKIKKVDFDSFSNMCSLFHFLQPGTVQPDGSFKKIQAGVVNTPSCKETGQSTFQGRSNKWSDI